MPVKAAGWSLGPLYATLIVKDYKIRQGRGAAVDQLHVYLSDIWDFFRTGFYQINALLGILIALYATYQMGRWQQIWVIALGATIAHIIATILIPVIDHDAALALPPLVELSFWRDTLALYLGYIVVVSVLFFLKIKVLRGGGSRH